MIDNLSARTIALADGKSSLSRITKPDTIRNLGPVEIGPLAAMVGRMSDTLWSKENSVKDNNFAVFHHTRHVVFRFPTDVNDPRQFRIYPAWNIWQQLLQPVIDQAIAPYGFTDPIVPKAMFARLEKGHVIDAHRDMGRANLLTHKIHVPVQTSEQALFRVADHVTHLALGEAYEVNNIKLHEVVNQGAVDRIHLIFEVFEGAQLHAV